jgi:hypothetical protein
VGFADQSLKALAKIARPPGGGMKPPDDNLERLEGNIEPSDGNIDPSPGSCGNIQFLAGFRMNLRSPPLAEEGRYPSPPGGRSEVARDFSPWNGAL